MMSAIVCHYPLRFFYSGETKLRRIVSNSIVLPVRATYIVRLQFDSVFKDVSCEVGFLEDSIKCSLVLGNTQKKKIYIKWFTGKCLLKLFKENCVWSSIINRFVCVSHCFSQLSQRFCTLT